MDIKREIEIQRGEAALDEASKALKSAEWVMRCAATKANNLEAQFETAKADLENAIRSTDKALGRFQECDRRLTELRANPGPIGDVALTLPPSDPPAPK